MLKIKNILPVLVVVLVMGLASTAFAQVTCTVGSTPVSRDSSTGLTEPAGDIALVCTQTGIGGSPSAAATVTVTYGGVPITNNTTIPSANYLGGGGPSKPISVTPTGGGCTVVTNPPVAVNNPAGSVVISLPAVGTGDNTVCQFSLTGVLLGLAGSAAPSPLKATISASAVTPPITIASGADTPTVVTSIPVPIVAAGVTSTGPGLVATTGVGFGAGTQTWSIKVTEAYFDMFRDVTTFNGGSASQGVQLKYDFVGIPTGASLGGCTTSITSGEVSDPPASIAAASPTYTLTVTDTPSLTATDTITLQCTTFTAPAATMTPGSITVSVTLAPVGVAFGAGNTVLSTAAAGGQIPRYTGPSFGPFTIFNIIPLTTHMLLPYVAVGNGFDTGIVIANTTTDPYGPPPAGGARAISGPVTIAFYPAGGGTAFCVSTGAGAATVNGIASCTTVTAGTGLSSGSVNSGGSYVVLASQLFAQVTGAPSAFTGYAFAIANFPLAHPTAFVADATFSGKFASGGPALVLPNPSVSSRSTGAAFSAALVESLGH